MKHIHRHLRIIEDGGLMLFHIHYHYDCEILVVDDFTIHPIMMNGIVGENIAELGQPITNEIYMDILGMLQRDGVC